MSNIGFINPAENVAKYFSEEALEEANEDFSGLFLRMFTEARRIAVDECGEDIAFEIDGSAWQRGKWSVLKRTKRGGWFGFGLTALRWINRLAPIGIGYSLSNLSERVWLFALSFSVFAVGFIAQARMEDQL